MSESEGGLATVTLTAYPGVRRLRELQNNRVVPALTQLEGMIVARFKRGFDRRSLDVEEDQKSTGVKRLRPSASREVSPIIDWD